MTKDIKTIEQQTTQTDTQDSTVAKPEPTKESETKNVKEHAEPKTESKAEAKAEPKETKETKETKEATEDVKVDVEDLKRQLSEAIEQGKQVETLTTTVSTMKLEMDSKDALINEYEGLLQNLITTKMEQIPEQYKDLVPDNMDLKQKLSWLEKAEAKGLFNKEEKHGPAIEIGKPMNVETPKPDIEKMSASSLLSMAYNTFKK